MKQLILISILSLFAATAIAGRTYDTPVTVPDETSAQVMAFGMVVVLNDSGNPSASSFFSYVVNTIDAAGNVTQSIEQRILWPDIPAARQDTLRDLHALVLTHAEANGIIQPGDDENDL